MCLRRLPDVETRPRTFEGTLVEMLLRASEFLRCFIKEVGLINLENWPSFPGAAVLGGLVTLSNDCWFGEGVKAGPCSGTGTRWKASWELISRTIASCNVSKVGWGLMALVEVYACLNISMISATFGFAEGRGDIEVGVADGRGLFMISAMLGLHFMSLLLGVGGWMAR